jgi:WbqC-like protein family
MRVTIHQPYFIPWLGYFSKLVFSDAFVILDNVSFSKRHYLDRTKYVSMDGEIKWLNLPVGENLGRKCSDVEVLIPDKTYVEKILRAISHSYAKADYYKTEWDSLREAIKAPLTEERNLVEINRRIIINIMNLLGLKLPDIYMASDLTNETDITRRIFSICNSIGADSLLIGGGKSMEVHEWDKIKGYVTLYIQDYMAVHPIYKQVRRQRLTFEKGLSIIDALLSVGKENTKQFVSDSRYSPSVVEVQ